MAMNTALVITLLLLMPASLMFSGSVILFCRRKSMSTLLQIAGAGCLIVVVLCHLSEALHLFPWMRWGLKNSVGHYLDFWGAVAGLTLFPIGYLLHAITG